MPGDRLGPYYWDDWSRPEYQEPWPDDDDDMEESTGWDEECDDEDPTY